MNRFAYKRRFFFTWTAFLFCLQYLFCLFHFKCSLELLIDYHNNILGYTMNNEQKTIKNLFWAGYCNTHDDEQWRRWKTFNAQDSSSFQLCLHFGRICITHNFRNCFCKRLDRVNLFAYILTVSKFGAHSDWR